MDFNKLYERAKSVLNPWQLSDYAESGGVGAAILTKDKNIYVGVCIDTACSMGFCAEHAAAAAMITAGENQILKMIAVDWDGRIMPPCGRCREFISQLHDENINTEVMVSGEIIMTIKELLPFDWRR
ncbi:MAG: cytidine deaminase [Clostridiales bacterium]|nr:cytidine deaminase [Clostridiales bacterium]